MARQGKPVTITLTVAEAEAVLYAVAWAGCLNEGFDRRLTAEAKAEWWASLLERFEDDRSALRTAFDHLDAALAGEQPPSRLRQSLVRIGGAVRHFLGVVRGQDAPSASCPVKPP